MRPTLPRHALLRTLAVVAVLATLAAGGQSRTAAAATLPACRYDDLPAAGTGYDDWATTLVDTIYRLPKGYEPPDLVPVARAGLEGGGFIRALVVDDLSAMLRAASTAGIRLRAVSAFRSEGTQAEILGEAERSAGESQALALTARPGHSEHQLGTTIDFGPADGSAPWEGDWGQSPEGRWLADNGWRFGFVMSYPAASSPSITCYSYEPWHFRYFGRDRAAAIHESGLTPREFLWNLEQAGATLPPSRSAQPQTGSHRAAADVPLPPQVQPADPAPADPTPVSRSESAAGPPDPLAIAVLAMLGISFLTALVRRRRTEVPAPTARPYRPRASRGGSVRR